MDLPTVQSVLTSESAGILPVTQWWLRTRGGAVPAGLPPGMTVTSRARTAAALLANPLSGLPQQAL